MVSIRELRHVPDHGPVYEEILDSVDADLNATAFTRLPRNLAALAAVQVVEHFAARANARAILELLPHTLGAAAPHLMPRFEGEILGFLDALTHTLRAVDRAGQPLVRPCVVDEQAIREAGVALVRSALAHTARSLLDEVAVGWRDFLVEGDVVTLRHRSPERLRRRIELALRGEAERNAAYIDAGAASGEQRELYEPLEGFRRSGAQWDWRRSRDLIGRAMGGARRAGEQLHRWALDPAILVGRNGRFTVGEYRAVSEVVHAIAAVANGLCEGIAALGAARVLRGMLDEWVDVLAEHSEVPREHAVAIVEFMTHDARDLRNRGRDGPPASSTPFLDLGDGERALSVTLAIWQSPEWALMTIWTSREQDDFGARVAERGHRLANEIGDLFGGHGWVRIVERDVPGGDLDSVAAVHDDAFLIVVEAKVFLKDPLKQLEEPQIWAGLADNVETLRNREVFERVFAQERLASGGEIVGLTVIPGRASPAVELGEGYGSVGFDDLRDLVAESERPRDLWRRIKATETAGTYPLRMEALAFGRWTLRFDVGDRQALPAAVRVKA